MLYRFLRVLVGFTLKLFFRKIYVSGTEHISQSKPQLIASNHPSGFLEPLIMACFFPKPLHFLVRGDVFDNPFLKPLLRGTNQIPVFRFKDGFSRLRENSQSIDESIQVLKDHQNLLIFVEGNTHSIKKLRPLQKGISRIAFQLMEIQPEADLEILPVGINFSSFLSFDEVIMLRIGPPLVLKNYNNSYESDKNNVHNLLLQDLYHQMKKNVVHLEDQSRIQTFEKLRLLQNIFQKEDYLPILSHSQDALDKEILLAQKIDALSTEKYAVINDALQKIEIKLHKSGLGLNALKRQPFSFNTFLLLILGSIPALIGLILHGLPLISGYVFMKRKVKQLEFKSSILMVADLALILLFYILLIVVFIFNGWPIYVLIIGFLCGIWLRYYYRKAKAFSFLKKGTFDDIKAQAGLILDQL